MDTIVVGIAAEDRGHFVLVTQLIDGVLLESYDWLDGVIDFCRHFRGRNEGELWYKYDPRDARDLRPAHLLGQRIGRHGHIGGMPLKAEASMWRNVLMMFCHSDPRPDVVVLARDLDGNHERLDGIYQVRDHLPWPFPVVVAAPQPETEAWLVAGFEPASEAEKRKLDCLCSILSFHPVRESHRLTSHPNDAATDAKAVLEALCGEDEHRRRSCIASLLRIGAGGEQNGVKAFLQDVQQNIVPLFRAPAR